MTKVTGSSDDDDGVLATTASSGKSGIAALNTGTSSAAFPGGNAVFALTHVPGGNGVFASNDAATGRGVQGNGADAGVAGFSGAGVGVLAQSNTGRGLFAQSGSGQAIRAESRSGDGISAETADSTRNAVFGSNTATGAPVENGGSGVFGVTTVSGGSGVFGANNHPTAGRGVQGVGPDAGVAGFSKTGAGVLAQSTNGVALHAQGSPLAARFEGNVECTGDIILAGQDLAEAFAIKDAAKVEAGSVLVINDEGTLSVCAKAYDRRVAGVVSGASKFRPGIVLGGLDAAGNPAIALVGRAYCKVDASHGPIAVGDLLTTSPTPGCAMVAQDWTRAFGAVLGKALATHVEGVGLVPILIALN
jgi:hypothetical protein